MNLGGGHSELLMEEGQEFKQSGLIGNHRPFLTSASREQRNALKRDLEPVVRIYNQL
jgi:hypothetical protein